MRYTPSSSLQRQELASAIRALLGAAKFTKVITPGTFEEVYEHAVHQVPGVKVLVYTTIVGDEVRAKGEDAIRVLSLYVRPNGEQQALFAPVNVNRVGELDEIASRTLQRAREAYGMTLKRVKSGLYCKACNAPFFRAKSGADVCARLCWKERNDS